MASSIPPSNPFDGFDSYSTVASPAMTASPHQAGAGTHHHSQQPQQQQQYAVPPEYQRAVASVALPQFAEQMLPRAGSGFRPPQQPVQQMQQQQPMQQQVQPVQPVQQQSVQQPQVQQQPVQLVQQQLVPAAPSAMTPWALPTAAAAAAAPPSSAGQLAVSNPFSAPPQQQQMIQMDPFAPQMPMQQQQQQLVPLQQPQYQQQPLLSPQYQIPPAAAAAAAQPMMAPQQQQQPQQQQSTPQQRLQTEVQGFFNDTPDNNNNNNKKPSSSALMDEMDEEGLGLIDVELDDDENNTSNNNNHNHRKADGEYYGKQHPPTTPNSLPNDKNANIAPPPPITPARPHAEYLSRQTASSRSGSLTPSPLPQPSLVHHSGYVLSRISFRTVLLRKWKQTFWIQYGPTQLLFFRTYSDYEDWLNNPYHTQKARDFLVKLRIDFVSDLKMKSVMGYQVTQIRRKPYGKNVMLHFKLERWMDYGPTIAAAFAAREEEMVHSPTHNHRNGGSRSGSGSGGGRGGEDYMNTTNDVASLRKIILGCMRNARDAALVARRGGGSISGEERDGREDVYRGRYSSDRDDYSNNNGTTTTTTNNNSSSSSRGGSAVSMGYHQAFSAESTPRRRMDMDVVENNNDDSPPSSNTLESVKTEESAEVATNGVVDLLG